MANPGIGGAPLGIGPYGVGQQTEAPANGGGIYRDAYGRTQGGRTISLNQENRGQYVYDEFGRAMGMPDVQQLVILALTTEFGSSASTSLGNRFKEVRHVDSNFALAQEARIRDALANIVNAGYISIDSITVKPGNGLPAITTVQMTNLLVNEPLDALTFSGSKLTNTPPV